MLEKRSFTLSGHRTSIALEAQFWAALLKLAQAEETTLLALVLRIDEHRAPAQKLASALRLHVLERLLQACPPA